MNFTETNRHIQANITAIMGYLAGLYHPKHRLYDPDEYEDVSWGIAVVHQILLYTQGNFKTIRGANRFCYNTCVKQIQFVEQHEKAGLVAARKVFEKRLLQK